MTDDDRTAFVAAYVRLARDLSSKTPDLNTVGDVFKDLRGFPLDVVTAALDTLRRTCRYMPRPVQLIGACQDAARAQAVSAGSVPAWLDRDGGRYHCDVCEDSGFERGLECPGLGYCHIGRCGKTIDNEKRVVPDAPHPFTRPCRCRASNPVLAHVRDTMRRPAEGDRA